MTDLNKEKPVIVTPDGQEKRELTTHQLLERFLEQQTSFLEKFDGASQKSPESKKKDKWDVLSSLSGLFTFLSSIIIALVGIYFTNTYKRQDVRITETQTVEKFLPSLNSQNAESRKGALLAVYGLQNHDLAARLAASYAAPENIDACEVIWKTAQGEALEQLTDSLVNAYKTRVEIERSKNDTTVDYQELIGNYERIFQLRNADYIKEKRGPWYLASIYTGRGNIYRDLNEFDKAREDYDRSLKIYPKFAWTFDNMGLMESLQNNFELAIQHINKAIEILPSEAQYYADLGEVYAKRANHEKDLNTKKKYLEDAETQFLKAVDKDPGNVWWHRVLASFYLENDMLDKAKEVFWVISRLSNDEAEKTLAQYQEYKIDRRRSGTTTPGAQNRNSQSDPQATPTPQKPSKASSTNRVSTRRPSRQRRRN